MEFFDFDDPYFEAAEPSSPSSSTTKPVTGGSTKPVSGTATKPAPSPVKPGATSAKPGPSAQPSSTKFASGPARPGPSPKPAPSPSKPSGPSTAQSFLNAFTKYAPAAFDWGSRAVQQFTAGGGKLSGQQAWDFARGALQQFGGLGGDQQAPAAADTGQPSAPAVAEPPAVSAPPGMGVPPAAAAAPAQPPSAAAPSGYPAPWPQAGATIDTVGLLLNALRQRQIPPLPGPYARPAAVPQQNAMTLLSLMLANPHLQRTLQAAHLTGVPPRSVELPVPATAAPQQTRQVQIPLGAVMNALTALAGQAMTELNESTPDDDPEMPSYLVGDDGDFLVDPGNP